MRRDAAPSRVSVDLLAGRPRPLTRRRGFVPRGLGVDALRPDLLEVPRRHEANQRARNRTVIRVRGAPKLLARVRVFVAPNAFPKAKLEPIQISIRDVRHVTVVRIDNGHSYPQPNPQFSPLSPLPAPLPEH